MSGDRRFIVNSGSPHSSTIRNANRVFEIYYLILKRKFILLRLCRTMRRRLQRGSSPLSSQPIRSTTCEGNPLSCMARARQYLLLAGRNIYIISCKSLSTSQLSVLASHSLFTYIFTPSTIVLAGTRELLYYFLIYYSLVEYRHVGPEFQLFPVASVRQCQRTRAQYSPRAERVLNFQRSTRYPRHSFVFSNQ